MGKLLDFLTGREDAHRREVRDQLSLREDVAVEEVRAGVEELRTARVRLQAVVDELAERRRGRNA